MLGFQDSASEDGAQDIEMSTLKLSMMGEHLASHRLAIRNAIQYMRDTIHDTDLPISPLADHCLTILTAHLSTLLTPRLWEPSEFFAAAAFALTCTNGMNNGKLQRHPKTPEQATLIRMLTDLRRDEIISRYNILLAANWDELKLSSSGIPRETPATFKRRPWDYRRGILTLSFRIKSEEGAWLKRVKEPKTVRDEEVVTTLTVLEACKAAGLNFDRMYTLLTADAEEVGTCFLDKVRKRQWYALKKMLCHDLVDLPLVCPGRMRSVLPILHAVLENVVDRYFVRSAKEGIWNAIHWVHRDGWDGMAREMEDWLPRYVGGEKPPGYVEREEVRDKEAVEREGRKVKLERMKRGWEILIKAPMMAEKPNHLLPFLGKEMGLVEPRMWWDLVKCPLPLRWDVEEEDAGTGGDETSTATSDIDSTYINKQSWHEPPRISAFERRQRAGCRVQ